MPTRAEAAKPTALPWGTISLLAMTAFASSGMMRTLDPMLPRLAREFDVPIGHAAWTITAFAVAYGVLQAFFGPLGDRHGKLRVIAGSAAVAVFACLGCAAAAGSFPGLIVARALAGACCAAAIPLSMAWIGDAVPYEQRHAVLARFMIGQMMGLASGQTLGGFAAEQSFWQWPFILFACVFAVAAILLWRRNARSDAPLTQTRAESGHAGQALLEVLRHPWARVVLCATLAEGICYLGAFTYVATHLHKVGGLPLNRAGLILIAFSGGGIAFAMFAHRWVYKLGEVRIVVVGTVLTVLSLATVSVLPLPLPAVIATFISGVGFYMMHNTLQINATQMAPKRRGASVALFATCFFVGQSIGVSICGFIGDHWGTSAALMAGAIGMLPVGLVFAYMLRTRKLGPVSSTLDPLDSTV